VFAHDLFIVNNYKREYEHDRQQNAVDDLRKIQYGELADFPGGFPSAVTTCLLYVA